VFNATFNNRSAIS